MKPKKASDLIVCLEPFEKWQRYELSLKESTIYERRTCLARFLEWAEEKPWSKETCQEYLAYLIEKGYKPSTRAGYYIIFRIFSRFLAKRKLAEDAMADVFFPWKNWKKRILRSSSSERTTFSPDEVEALTHFHEPLKTGKGSLSFRREIENLYNGYFLTLASTGCRKGEALGLKVQDVNLSAGIVIFRDTKAGDSRRVPIPPQLIRFLEQHFRKYELKGSDPVFFSIRRFRESGWIKGLRRGTPELELKRRVKVLGIKRRIYQHMFRHTVATELIKADVSILKVQRILGHHDVSVTQLYTQLVTEDLREAQLRLPYLSSGEDPQIVCERIKGFVKGLDLQKMAKKGKIKFEMIEKPRELKVKVGW